MLWIGNLWLEYRVTICFLKFAFNLRLRWTKYFLLFNCRTAMPISLHERWKKYHQAGKKNKLIPDDILADGVQGCIISYMFTHSLYFIGILWDYYYYYCRQYLYTSMARSLSTKKSKCELKYRLIYQRKTILVGLQMK